MVEAGDAKSKATISVSSFFSIGEKIGRYRFAASAPFDRDKADSVDIGTLSALAGGTSVSAEFSWAHWPKADERADDAQTTLCRAIVRSAIPGYSIENTDYLGVLRCAPEDMTAERFEAAVKDLNLRRTACAALAPAARDTRCQRRISLPAAQLSPAFPRVLEKARALPALIEETTSSLHLWTLGATGTKQNMSYVLPTAPTQVLKHTDTSEKLTAAYTRISDRLLWSVGYAQEQGSSVSAKVEVCSPIDATGSLRCSDASIGAPEEEKTETVFAEGRWAGVKLAVSPRLEYDAEESEWGLRVPVYLVRNTKGAFTGGLAAGYTTTDDDWQVAVFVGKEFSLFD